MLGHMRTRGTFARRLDRFAGNFSTLQTAAATANPRVFGTLLGPAVRGFVLQQGKNAALTRMHGRGDASFDWTYERKRPEIQRLTKAARTLQWDADDLPWHLTVDPHDPAYELFAEADSPMVELPEYRMLPRAHQERQRADLLAWMLSQFLHGEQGALHVACQVTAAVEGVDGKLYGATQVMDEGRHVEVFDRYLRDKLQKRYVVNDNLHVILDALVGDRRWDLKFLGMQILVEGLALAAFGMLRQSTREPLLRELLRLVITDEARHVHFGVVALQGRMGELGATERREREDWAYEICVLLRNRFLNHEFYDEHWGHRMSRRAWDRFLLGSNFMHRWRRILFRRIVPNLVRIELLPDRLRPHYATLGILEFEHEKAAPDLTVAEMTDDVG